MQLFKSFLFTVLLVSFVHAKTNLDQTIHILVENKSDYQLAKDIKEISKSKIGIDVYYDDYKNIIQKVLTDPKAQFAIVPHDLLVYERDVVKTKAFNFEKHVKLILPLYDKYIYILTRKDSKINSVQNLLGKRVNIELDTNKFSVTGRLIQKKHSIKWRESHYSFDKALKQLMDKKIDAMILIDVKKSQKLLSLDKNIAQFMKLIPSDLGKNYSKAYIDTSDFSWMEGEVQSDIVNTVLISYNYQKSETIQRFNYYVNNISTLIYLISKNFSSLANKKNSYWKDIQPYYYRKVHWSLHSVAKASILKYMDLLNNFSNTFGMAFVSIPSGSFIMGSKNKTLPKDEQPQHKQSVESFSVMTTEVTQEKWMEVMQNNPSHFKGEKLPHYWGKNPVDSVSYEDAKKFIDKLNTLELRGNYRLPSETEWEYLAGETPKSLEEYAWFSANSQNKTQRVASKKPNKWGLYDTLGNVWEWCDSYYTSSYAKDAKVEHFKVLRGGSFVNLSTNTRSSNRMKNLSSIKRFNNGFRLVYDRKNTTIKSVRYAVKVGDSLSSIASKFYNDRSKWDLIYYSNKDIIGSNISFIKVGEILKIPTLKRKNIFAKEEKSLQTKLSKQGIKLLSGIDFKPFLSPSLPYGGMANHIVKESFKAIGESDYKIFWNKTFATHFGLLERQKFDVGIAWYKPDCSKNNLGKETQKRCEFTFSKPIFEVITTLYKDKNRELNSSSVKDLYGSKICRPHGVYTFDLENQGLIDRGNITLVRPESKKACFQMLIDGEVDFVAVDKFSGKAMIHEMNIGKRIESIETISTLLGLHLIVHSKHPRAKEIISKLNRGVEKLKNSGKLLEIQRDHLSNFFK